MEERTTVARKSENGQMLQTIKVWQGDSLHHFSDASQDGYGQVTYLRILDGKGYIKCSLVMAKSRVAPTKFVLTSHKCFKYVKKRFQHSFIQQSRNTFGQTERLYWVISITMQNLLKSFWQTESS